MISRRNALLRATACAAALLGGSSAALAQGSEAWPTRTVKLIVPYAAGGYADTRARLIADSLGKVLGQPVIIDNRGGAGGVTGTDAIAKANDGHTFGFGSPGPLVTNPMLMKKMPYDARTAFKPIILIEQAPLFLTTAPNQPFKSVQQLLAHAKAQPGDLTYGSSGVGGAHHLSGELLAYQTQTQLTHVPYKGGSLAASDLMGGHLAMMFEMGYSALPSIKARKINALAVSSKTRLSVLPEVPTLDEAGVKGFESYNWLGMIAPAGTPDAVVTRLNQAVNEALKNDKSLRQMIESSGGQIMGGTPQAYGKYLEAERAKWGPVIKNANISLD
ncbi:MULTISPECIES: Bug family tripartite tricarboxylate transporter substrate binding protein [Comamonas]|uniref:Bug family tripartite tricarboxylate transporter substrate binding protein n=1 Tax=Comamonas TaxID=283 RepID=UPI0012C64B96|nr:MULTISPECIES: tripartite tricarboxylate transporter substrate binding protein [Comamonas]MEB5967305.1 tripartite tricarboxylate transporter substrate binding protein [Comamonas testosteroni]MPS92444.1 tripartite tricarboxylate transporter substrate binding protein [Comamonas sp.]